MKKLLLTLTMLAIIGLSNFVNAQAPNWAWAKSAGGAATDRCSSVATDASGNVFMAGSFESPVIIFGTSTLTNTGSADIFIVKYDASGNVLWANSAGGTAFDKGFNVATDAGGNVFITGIFGSPTITFGTTTLTNAGSGYDIFIAKYDASGNVLWANSTGGVGYDWGYDIAADAGGNVFMTGYFYSTAITIGATTLTNADSTGNSADIFIVKYDASGNVFWAKREGNTADDMGKSVATDASGNVFMTGSFLSDSITFGTTTLTNAGVGEDIFIAKYDASGNVLWAKSAGGTDGDVGYSVATDASNNVFITGSFFSPTITFGATTLTNGGLFDIYIVKYDASGNVLWAKSEGGTEYDEGYSVASDASSNVFMTGYFYSPTITFGTTTLINAGSLDYVDVFVVKYDSSGNIIWAESLGGTDDDYGYSVATDASGNLFIGVRDVSPTINFGTIILSTSGMWVSDVFIAKLVNLTGIESALNTNGISIYPNPVIDELTISSEQWAMGKEVILTIMDITGKIIYTTTATSTQKTEVNTSDFAEGVYLVRVQTNDFIETKKVIITK